VNRLISGKYAEMCRKGDDKLKRNKDRKREVSIEESILSSLRLSTIMPRDFHALLNNDTPKSKA